VTRTTRRYRCLGTGATRRYRPGTGATRRYLGRGATRRYCPLAARWRLRSTRRYGGCFPVRDPFFVIVVTRETGHTHNNTTRTTPRQEQHHKQTTTRTNPPHNRTNEPPHPTLNNALRWRDDGAYHRGDDMFTPERHLPTPRQRGHSPQRHTAAGTAAPTTTYTGSTVPQRANPAQTAYAHPRRRAQG